MWFTGHRDWWEVVIIYIKDSKVHGANMGPTWVLSAPCWPHEPCYQGLQWVIYWYRSGNIHWLSLHVHYLNVAFHSVKYRLMSQLSVIISDAYQLIIKLFFFDRFKQRYGKHFGQPVDLIHWDLNKMAGIDTRTKWPILVEVVQNISAGGW